MSSSIFGVMLMNPRRSGTSNQRCSVSDFNRPILQIKCQTKSDNPVNKRDARLRFDSHLKRWELGLTLEWHYKIPRTRMDRGLIVIDKLSETMDSILHKGR